MGLINIIYTGLGMMFATGIRFA